MSEQDWEKRAQELLMAKDGRFGEWVKIGAVQHALQLGREMADARAEEIAKSAEAGTWFNRAEIAKHARSFISKPAGEVVMTMPQDSTYPTAEDVAYQQKREAAIRADERERIAKGFERRNEHAAMKLTTYLDAAAIARASGGQPKTREQVLEEALREIASKGWNRIAYDAAATANRALEWKP